MLDRKSFWKMSLQNVCMQNGKHKLSLLMNDQLLITIVALAQAKAFTLQ